MHGLIHDIQMHIRARYPILYLISHEEERLWKILQHLSQQESIPLFSWKRTHGLQQNHEKVEGTHDPSKGLEHLFHVSHSAICVLWDFHLELQDPTVLRWLRDLCMQMGRQGVRRWHDAS